MPSLSEPKQRRHLLGSSRSITRLLERRWLVVVLALALTARERQSQNHHQPAAFQPVSYTHLTLPTILRV